MEYINKNYELHHSSIADLSESGPDEKHHQGFRGAFYDPASGLYPAKKSSGSI